MRFSRLLIAVLVAAWGGGYAHANCDPDEIVVKFSHVAAPTGHPKGEAAAHLATLVNEKMDGRMCMEVFPNSLLYDDTEAVQALLDDKVQMVAPATSALEAYTQRLRLFDLPFLFRDNDALLYFQESFAGKELLGTMEGKGLLGLGFWNDGLKQISADRSLLLPVDAKGMTFRIQSSEILAAQFKALGAYSRKMEIKSVYATLLSGAVDGQENTWSNIYTKRFFEVQDGITETNHGALLYIVLVAKEFWENLPDEARRELHGLVRQTSAERNHLSAEINRESRRQIIASGGFVRTLTEEQRRAWQIAVQPVWEEFQDEIGAELIEAARQSGGQ